MDSITRDLDNLIVQYDFDDRGTDVACYNKIKMDYYLMLTIAATWDMKRSTLTEDKRNQVIKCLHRPETGKLIGIIDTGLDVDKNIVDVFNLYKEGRNLKFGHTTFDSHEAEQLNKDCSECWERLLNLPPLASESDNMLKKLFKETIDFYYI